MSSHPSMLKCRQSIRAIVFASFVSLFAAAQVPMAAAQNFSLTATAFSPQAGVTPGGQASAGITLTTTNSYNGTVTFTCSVAPPSGVTNDVPLCLISPSSAVPNATLSLTVTTGGRSIAGPVRCHRLGHKRERNGNCHLVPQCSKRSSGLHSGRYASAQPDYPHCRRHRTSNHLGNGNRRLHGTCHVVVSLDYTHCDRVPDMRFQSVYGGSNQRSPAHIGSHRVDLRNTAKSGQELLPKNCFRLLVCGSCTRAGWSGYQRSPQKNIVGAHVAHGPCWQLAGFAVL